MTKTPDFDNHPEAKRLKKLMGKKTMKLLHIVNACHGTPLDDWPFPPGDEREKMWKQLARAIESGTLKTTLPTESS